MAVHRDLADSELHEPKGMQLLTGGAPDVGKVITSLGNGSSEVRRLTLSEIDDADAPARRVVVNSKADFPAPVAGVITLAANTVYLLGDDINLGTDRIVLGANTAVMGIDRDNVLITYTGTSPMFTASAVSVLLDNFRATHSNSKLLSFSDSGTGGNIIGICDVFSLVSAGWLEVTTSATVGTGILLENSGAFNCTGDAVVTTGNPTFLRSMNTSFTMTGGFAYDLGTSVFDSIRINANGVFIIDAAAGFLKGAAASANLASGSLATVTDCRIGNMGAGTLLSGIAQTDVRWRFFENTDIIDTRPDALASFNGNAVATPIAAGDGDAGNPKRVVATWAASRLAQFTLDTAGRLTFTGEVDTVLPITINTSAVMASGTGSDIKFYIALNGTAITDSQAFLKIDNTDVRSASTIWQHTFTNGDYIELFVSNESSTANVIVDTAVMRIN